MATLMRSSTYERHTSAILDAVESLLPHRLERALSEKRAAHRAERMLWRPTLAQMRTAREKLERASHRCS